VKWDGFRALVSTEDGLVARSRRGWIAWKPLVAHLERNGWVRVNRKSPQDWRVSRRADPGERDEGAGGMVRDCRRNAEWVPGSRRR
jgi:hypothetical protein